MPHNLFLHGIYQLLHPKTPIKALQYDPPSFRPCPRIKTSKVSPEGHSTRVSHRSITASPLLGGYVEDVVPTNKSIAVLILQLASLILLSLLEGDIHESVQTRENA
jgi:hypothetical protein